MVCSKMQFQNAIPKCIFSSGFWQRLKFDVISEFSVVLQDGVEVSEVSRVPILNTGEMRLHQRRMALNFALVMEFATVFSLSVVARSAS